MDSLIGVEIKQYLERNFDIVLSIAELRQLKLKDIKKLAVDESTDNIERNTQPESVGNFLGKFQGLSCQQLIPTETIVHMNSIKNGIPLVFLHPIEGSVHMLQPLANLLSCPVYGLQCTPDAPTDSVEALAAWYWQVCMLYYLIFVLLFLIYLNIFFSILK